MISSLFCPSRRIAIGTKARPYLTARSGGGERLEMYLVPFRDRVKQIHFKTILISYHFFNLSKVPGPGLLKKWMIIANYPTVLKGASQDKFLNRLLNGSLKPPIGTKGRNIH